MRYPAFIAEMDREVNRPKLWFGVWSGYSIGAGFATLAVTAVAFDLTPFRWAFVVLLAIKFLTNTLALVALRRDVLALEAGGLNIVADAVLMTGAIYYTGGPASPLVATYVISICVLGLLTNLGVTLMMSAVTLVCFTAMTIMVSTGTLPLTALPTDPAGGVGLRYVVTVLCFALFVIGVPTFFTSRILHLLQRKEHALEERTAELIEAGKQKSLFMANVTHELRTPIHGVCGLSDLIAGGVYGPTTEKQQAACESIKRTAQGLLTLIDDLLALTRAEVGKLELRPAPVDLRDLVASTASSVSWMIGTKKLTLATDVPSALPPLVSDRRLLGQVLVNLVANAVKFTPEGGRVTIAVRAIAAAGVAVSVTDTGIGIPEDQHEAIFEEFRQVDGSDERGYGGAGLGLALVRRMVAILGGDVTVASTLDRGSTFTITLPPEPPPPPVVEVTPDPSSRRRPTTAPESRTPSAKIRALSADPAESEPVVHGPDTH